MNILIGNLVALAAACFLAASCISRNNRRVFAYQCMESLTVAVSSLFFMAYAASVSMLLSALRNWLVSRGRYPKPVMLAFLAVGLVLGCAINVRGWLGLVPVIATAQYTLCCYYVKGVLATKYSIAANLLMWVVYSFMILDFSTAISNAVVLVLDIGVIIRMHREKSPPAIA